MAKEGFTVYLVEDYDDPKCPYLVIDLDTWIADDRDDKKFDGAKIQVVHFNPKTKLKYAKPEVPYSIVKA